MAIAKGRILADYTYVYSCKMCGGTGFLLDAKRGDIVCHHCYNLDYDKLMEAFATARGERYYAILKAILSIKGKAMCDRFKEVEKAAGRHLWVSELFVLCFREFGFPENRMKPFVEWLEEARVLPTGAYDRLRNRGMKVRATLEAVKASGQWGNPLPLKTEAADHE